MKKKLVQKSIAQVLKQNLPATILLIFAICGVVVASLIPPQILKQIIDVNLSQKTMNELPALAATYLGVVAFIGIFDFVKEAVLTVLGQKITSEIRYGMMQKMERLPALFFSKNDTGAVMSRFTNDVDAINDLFTGGIIGMLVDSFKVIGIVISIWIFSSRLGILTLLLLPLIYVITRFFQNRMLGAQIKNRIQTGMLNNHIAESLKSIRMIKVFNKESYMEKRYTEYLSDNYRTIEKINFFDSVFPPVIQIVRALVIALVVVCASQKLHFLGISLGMVAASIELISNLFSPIENIGMEFQDIQGAVSGIRRVNDFNDKTEDDEKTIGLRAEDIIPDRKAVSLAFNDLSFNYDEDTDVLQNIRLGIRPCEKVTFTGRTGVGKTTLFRLVMGLLKPVKGNITLNGVDVYAIPNGEKKKIFGYVDQNFFLIRGTVADQITLKDSSVPRVAVEKALGFVGLSEYVAGLEKGMDTELNGDSLFSQGQKQLLSIARAIVTDPPILLLDEMTANLDSITEEKIVTVLQKVGAERTILAISHRPSSLISSDTVVILENGRIKNAGSPDALLRTDDWYRSHVALENLTWS